MKVFFGLLMGYAALLQALPLDAQEDSRGEEMTFRVKGIIRDAQSHEPLAAAQILALNQQVSATADTTGTFVVDLGSGSEVLLITAFDHNPREIPVRGQKELVIDLYPLVFTGSYRDIEGLTGISRSAVLTSSASDVEAPDLPYFTSLDEMLPLRKGADVRGVSRSGVPGLGSSLFIRGYHSLNRNSQPLFVVDGVIWNNFYDRMSLHEGYFANTLADIDMNDIGSITVIKDGTSIYGSKGSNGVIVIRTKRARDLPTRITLNALAGIVEKPNSLPVMDGDRFRIYATDLLGSMDLSPGLYDELEFLRDDPSTIGYEVYHNETDWSREVYRRGFTQSYNLSVTGGDDKALYAFSLGYTGNNGVVKSTDLERLNMRFNGDFRMMDFFSIGLNVGFTNIDRVLLDDGVDEYTSPTYLAMIKAPFLSPYSYTVEGTLTTDLEDSDLFGVGNPTAIIANALNTNSHYRLNLSALPVIQFSESLSLSSQFDYSLDKVKETYFSPMTGVADRYLPGLGVSENVFRSLQVRNDALFNDTRLRYGKSFGPVHRIRAVLGWRYSVNSLESDYAEGHNSGTDQKRNLLNEEEFKQTEGRNDAIRSVSNYASVDYSYDNRYFLTATMALDGSSRFGEETQSGFQLFGHSWGFFPSLHAAWLVSSESFMASTGFINLLKLRAGFGLTGNDDIDPWAWSPYFTSVKYLDRANGIILGNVGNPEIQWETTSKLGLGIDAQLLNDRLSLSTDVYRHHTRDLLYLDTLPALAGAGYYWNNGGELSNSGFELTARVKVLNLRNFQWEVNANIGHYKNTIRSLPGKDYTTPIYGAVILTSAGNPAGLFYGYKTRGVLRNEEEASAANLKRVDADGNESFFAPGDVHFIDHFQDGIIDEKDRQVIGDPNPDLYGSFGSMFRYRNLSLDVYFSYSYGNDVYNYLRRELETGSFDGEIDETGTVENGLLKNQSTAMLDRWITEDQQTGQPKAVSGDPMGNARFSDRWIEDGSYLKLKALKLNYTVPLKGRIIEGLNLWIAARNVWTWTGYLGRDPEVSAGNAVLYQGIDTGLVPQTRTYFIGLKMNL